MSTKTTNYELIKPELSDPADITQTNANWDKLDQVIKSNLDEAKEYANQKVSDIPTPNVSEHINKHNTDDEAHSDIRTAVSQSASKALSDAKTYTDNKIKAIPTPDVSGQINTHNTSGTAHSDIRTALNEKAPAGFGLGGTAVAIDSWNNAKANGYYYSNIDAPNALTWYGHVVVSSGNDILVQTVYCNINGVIHRCVRRRIGGSFGDWEWDNPPLSGGMEYRTTERLEGKAVYKRAYEGGAIEYRLDGESTWKKYANAVGAAQATHYHDASDVGAVDKNGDTMYGSLTVNGAITVQRGETDRKARTVVYDSVENEIEFQNYTSDTNYVGLRMASEATGAGDAVKIAHMKNGEFASYTVLHTGNKEKIFTYGTSDLTAGTSSLGTGMLYFVYE